MSETNNSEWVEQREATDEEEVQQSQQKDTTDNLRGMIRRLREGNPDVIERMREVVLGKLPEDIRGRLEGASLEEVLENHLGEEFDSMEPDSMNNDQLVSSVIESSFAGIVGDMSEQDQTLIDSKRANTQYDEPNEENYEQLEKGKDDQKARKDEKIKAKTAIINIKRRSDNSAGNKRCTT